MNTSTIIPRVSEKSPRIRALVPYRNPRAGLRYVPVITGIEPAIINAAATR